VTLRLRRIAAYRDIPPSFEELGTCDGCIYWEHPDEFGRGFLDPYLKKEWLEAVLAAWGNCALVASMDDDVVGYAQYAPPRFYASERLAEYPSGPVSDDAVLLSCLFVRVSESRRQGVGTALLHGVVEDLRSRGERAVETFARRGSENNPSGPVDLYLARGFRIVREVDEFPLMRLDLTPPS
jgi:GNAT superfamily N-acetyltransferase